jgi:DNA-binding HxlR family transcriptional regulator
MRSYGQYSGLAKTLDIIGDRWTLLIVRELLVRPCRYSDLQQCLPGIATNLLANRVREMEEAGILTREEAPSPIATTLFRLTKRGKELEPALLMLDNWGAPLLLKSDGQDAFRAHWLALPLQLHLSDQHPRRPPIAIELRTGDGTLTIETVDGSIQTRIGAVPNPDAVLTGTPQLIMGVLVGKRDLDEARAAGLQFEGDRSALRRVQSSD